MDEFKKINASKYRNKQRYKNKSKVVHKQQENEGNKKEDDKIIVDDSNLFQKRGLETNWYRYEPKHQDEKDNSRDFSVLASVPIAQGNYFQFKSDKNVVDIQDIKQIDNKLFYLDVNLLNLSIATIPFYTQCGIEKKYFMKSQLDRLKEEAQNNIFKYDAYLQSNRQINECGNSLAQALPKDTSGNSQNATENEDFKNKADDLNNFESSKNNLEQWLDNILDD